MPNMFRWISTALAWLLVLQTLNAGSGCSRQISIESPYEQLECTHFLSLSNLWAYPCTITCIAANDELLLTEDILPQQSLTLSLADRPKFCVFTWQDGKQVSSYELIFNAIKWQNQDNLITLEDKKIKAPSKLVGNLNPISDFQSHAYLHYPQLSHVKKVYKTEHPQCLRSSNHK